MLKVQQDGVQLLCYEEHLYALFITNVHSVYVFIRLAIHDVENPTLEGTPNAVECIHLLPERSSHDGFGYTASNVLEIQSSKSRILLRG